MVNHHWWCWYWQCDIHMFSGYFILRRTDDIMSLCHIPEFDYLYFGINCIMFNFTVEVETIIYPQQVSLNFSVWFWYILAHRWPFVIYIYMCVLIWINLIMRFLHVQKWFCCWYLMPFAITCNHLYRKQILIFFVSNQINRNHSEIKWGIFFPITHF